MPSGAEGLGRGCTGSRVWPVVGEGRARVVDHSHHGSRSISLAQVLPMGLGDPDSSLSKKVLGGCLPPLDCLFLLREPATISPPQPRLSGEGFFAGLSYSHFDP